MCTKSDLRKLNLIDCDTHFHSAKRSVIFIDHEALPTVDYAKDSMRPTRSTLDDLDEISLDNRNIVIIFSN